MPEYEGISQFRKAAARRLSDARTLIDISQAGSKGEHRRGAVYLAGYAIECTLKVYFIDQQGAVTLTDAVDRARGRGVDVPNLVGAEGHNLLLLVRLTDLEAMLANDVDIRKTWGICLRWRSTWRYDPQEPPETFAREFIDATAQLFRWIERRI